MELNEEVKEKIIQMWDDGKHIYEIAREMPYCENTSYKIIEQMQRDGVLKWRSKRKIVATKIKDMYLSGQSIPEISQKTDLSESTVKCYLYSENMKLQQKKVSKKTLDIMNMIRDGVEVSKICSEKKVSRQYIYFLQSQMGIPTKHKVTAEKIKEMYDSGMCVEQISEKVERTKKTVLFYLYSYGYKNIRIKEVSNKTIEIFRMLNEGVKVSEISKKMNVSRAYIYILRKNIGKYPMAKSVIQYDINGNFISRFDSIKSASETLNIDPSTICAICRKRIKSSHGYIFKYEKEII